MRVVADTNTAVSAFLWGGPPAAVLAAAREGRITLFTNPVLLAELKDVLSCEKFAERIVRVGSSVAQMLAGYRALVTIVRPAVIEPTARDPDATNSPGTVPDAVLSALQRVGLDC